MKPTNYQSGFTPLHILLLLVLLSIIGFTGWRVYDASKTPELGTLQPEAPETAKAELPEGFVQYQNQELGLKFSYPQEWGEANVRQGELVPPSNGTYYQATFTSENKVNINFVVAGFSSPLDACGYEYQPVKAEQFVLAADRTQVIGWDAGNIKILVGVGQGNPEEKVELLVTGATEIRPAIEKLGTNGGVMAYKAIRKEPWKAKKDSGEGLNCGEITQAEADEANEYRKFVKYALNYSNDKVKGVNAQYDARSTFDQKISDQIIESLNTVESL